MTTATWNSWIEGPRWNFPSGWMEKQIMQANVGIRRAARATGRDLGELELVRIDERTSFMTRTIFFTIRGDELALGAFRDLITKTLRDHGALIS